MKIVCQNVVNSSLFIDNKEYSSINKGYLLLVSFTNGDNHELVEKMAKKLINMRVFQDSEGKTNLSILDVKGEILSVSQFTLYADLEKGNRPSFVNYCLNPKDASELYDYFNHELEKYNVNVKTGVFGEDMQIHLINDGPFTIILDSKELF